MKPQPWDRQAGESAEAYHRFTVYRDLQAPRTIRAAWAALGNSGNPNGAFKRLAKRWEWAARADAWDRRLTSARLRGAEQAAERDGAVWERRRTDTLETTYNVAWTLLQKAKTAARLPVVSRRVVKKDGNSTIIIEPLPLRDLKSAAEVASSALSMLMSTIEHAEDAAASQTFDPATCDDPEVLRQFIYRFADRAG